MSLAIFCGCTARFVWDLVGNPEDQFSDVAAHIMMISLLITKYLAPQYSFKHRVNAVSGN